MVRRLLAQGQRVIVWSRDPSRHLALATLGARLTDSIPDAVASTDVVIGCLRDTAVTRECYLGASGAARHGMHMPLPSQQPEPELESQPFGRHSLSGSVLTLTKPHTPSIPLPVLVPRHDWQVPAHA